MKPLKKWLNLREFFNGASRIHLKIVLTPVSYYTLNLKGWKDLKAYLHSISADFSHALYIQIVDGNTVAISYFSKITLTRRSHMFVIGGLFDNGD